MSSMGTAFFNGPSYASPIRYVYGERDGASGLPSKVVGTGGARKCSFSIDAILSTGPREPSQLGIEMHRGTALPAPPVPPLWVPAGYTTPGSPYSYQYMSYQPSQPSDIYHHAVYNEGFDGQCGKLMSRRNYVRRTCRRIRTIFTDEQVMKLEEVFSKQRYMTGTEKVLLASALRLSETQVKVWFQNRRTRWRKTQEDKATGYPANNGGNQRCSPNEEDEFISVDEEESLSS